MSVGCSFWFQVQACSGEAALDEAGLVLDLLQAVPEDLDQVGEAGDGEVGEHAALEHRPDPLNRFAIVHGSLDRRLRARRLSAGRGCFGWWSGPGGCGHATRRVAGRRWRGGRGHPPRMTALTKVPKTELWTLFPEATRNDVLRLLGMLLERWAVSAGPAEGTGGEHGAAG